MYSVSFENKLKYCINGLMKKRPGSAHFLKKQCKGWHTGHLMKLITIFPLQANIP